MEFGIFHSGHVPTQATADAQRRLEHRRLLDEVEVAVTGDRNGFKYSWFTEHHFLEEYSHVSASEVLMGYVAARTEQIHLGSGIFNLTPPVNHPARVAERVSMLDHLSNGRFEFGTGRGSSSTEYQGFGIPDPDTTRDLFDEALPEVVRMLQEAPYAHDGRRVLDARAHRAARGRGRCRTRRCGSRAAARRRSRRPGAWAWARCASRWATPKTSHR